MREDDIKEDMDLTVSLEDSFKAAMHLFRKGAKTLGREALETGLDIARDVVQGRNIKQAAKSRLKSTGHSLLQKAMDTVGPSGQRAIKGPAKRKDQTSADQATEHIE